jgi:hypothetical protein
MSPGPRTRRYRRHTGLAVTVNARGFNIHTIGVILMIVGLIGALLSLVSWSSWSGFGGGGPARTRRRVIEDDVV